MLYYFIQFNTKVLLVLFAFGFIMSRVKLSVWKNLSDKTGGYVILDFFNLIGTPVHELSHLLFAVLFGYHIDGICLYRRVKTARKHGSTLGYVKMHHKENTVFQRIQKETGLFFIGTGPLILPPLFLLFIGTHLPAKLRALPSAFGNGWDSFYKSLHLLKSTDIIILFTFLYAIIGISMNMELSRQDLQMAFKGLIMLEICLLIISLSAYMTDIDLIVFIDILFRWNLLVASVGIIFAMAVNLVALISS
ncbi:MAG: hypothetical protein LUF92_07085 [Clostridiales bacterium]|nr:hypothetical protein [Clostridiales bacterium]